MLGIEGCVDVRANQRLLEKSGLTASILKPRKVEIEASKGTVLHPVAVRTDW
jgi:hypothetical protein